MAKVVLASFRQNAPRPLPEEPRGEPGAQAFPGPKPAGGLLKDGGPAVLILRDARTLTRLCGSACACALLRMRTAELAARRRTVFGNSRLTMSNSHSRSRGAFLRPGFCILCFTDPESRGGRSAEKRSGAQRNTREACTLTRQARRLRGALRPMTRDARLSALHRSNRTAGIMQ